MWHLVHSLFSRPNRVAIVALLLGDEERTVLTNVSSQEQWDVHFVESCQEACAAAERLSAPVILYDRDWPGAEWRNVVQNLASSPPQRACVILTSRVADDYLWEELIRQGGYDVLTKPLRAADVARVIKLALSYWSARRSRPFSRRTGSAPRSYAG